MQQQEVTVMKLSIVAAATVFALSSAGFAQTSDGLNGSTLGQSQPGVNAGVPYPSTTATDNPAPKAAERTAPAAGSEAKPDGATAPKHSKHRENSAMKAASKKPPVSNSGAGN
jgi:hypothetical protein